MKICVTTSDRYHHIIPIFCYLFNQNWGSEYKVEIVGYKKPEIELPDNFSFVSLGKQGGDPSCFGADMRAYFQQQEEWFIWLFEDSFMVSVEHDKLDICKKLMECERVGRINLTASGLVEENIPFGDIEGYDVYQNTQKANYRLSTQPSIWNKNYLLQYLTKGLTPWRFETQYAINDGWNIIGLYDYPIVHNEGVRKKDIHAYNLSRIKEEQIEEMKQLKLI